MDMEERAARRRERMQVHRAKGFLDADQWDLDFWQTKSPEERLSALIAIQDDVSKAEAAGRVERP
jgi:hypothetical protein